MSHNADTVDNSIKAASLTASSGFYEMDSSLLDNFILHCVNHEALDCRAEKSSISNHHCYSRRRFVPSQVTLIDQQCKQFYHFVV